MVVKDFLMHSFASAPTERFDVIVPEGSIFLGAKILNDGVYVWYQMSTLEGLPTRTDSYIMAVNSRELPEGAEFVALLDTIIETPKGQGVVVFPIFKLKS